jgi:4-amino-4-deoxy-L-arabinose transferase-like glycosyltransferase
LGKTAEVLGRLKQLRLHDVDRFFVALGATALAGLVFRVLYVLAHAGEAISGDGVGYYRSAHLLSAGEGFVKPDEFLMSQGRDAIPAAIHPPAWTLLLAPMSLLGLDSVLSHQLWACLVGAATIGVVGLAGRRLAGDRAGLVAAAIAAAYPNFWMYERVLLSETLALLLVAVCLLATHSFWAEPSSRTAALVGVSCGLLALTRAEALLIVGLLIVPLVWLRREVDHRVRSKWLALAIGGTVLTVAPWAVYNTARMDHLALLTTNLGSTLASANCDELYDGPHIGWWSYDCLSESAAATAAAGDASAVDLAQRRYALRYMRANADRLPIVVLAREGRTWGLFQPFQQARMDAVGGPDADVILLGLGAYWLLLPAAVAGAVVLRRRGVPLLPVLAVAVTVIVATGLTIGQTRYRAMAEVPLVLLAAVAIDSWLRRPSDGATVVAEAERVVEEAGLPVGRTTAWKVRG